jgi:hypothetical protein
MGYSKTSPTFLSRSWSLFYIGTPVSQALQGDWIMSGHTVWSHDIFVLFSDFVVVVIDS